MQSIFAILLLVAIILQLLCAGPILQCLLKLFFNNHIKIKFKGLGLWLPFLFFRARHFEIIFSGNQTRDQFQFKANEIQFRIDPVFLLIGRLRILNLKMKQPLIDYVNRLESFQKNRFLPSRYRIEIKNAFVYHGEAIILDETMTPNYRLQVTNIYMENLDLDIATSVDLFFRTGHGIAQIGSGKLEIGHSNGSGYIRLWNVTWSEIMGMGNVMFLNGKIALEAFHSGGAAGREVVGSIGTLPASDSKHKEHLSMRDIKTKIPFKFFINWNDYQLTLDLGLQKLIGKMLESAKAENGFQGSVAGGLSNLFELIKKQEKE